MLDRPLSRTMTAGGGLVVTHFCTARLAAHSVMLASAATDAIIKKKCAFSMLLQKPPRKPPKMSPGSVVANHTPIMREVMRAGASLEINASPTGARCSSPTVARAKYPTSHSVLALPPAAEAAPAITRLASATQMQPKAILLM